jgi:hypothetical protein
MVFAKKSRSLYHVLLWIYLLLKIVVGLIGDVMSDSRTGLPLYLCHSFSLRLRPFISFSYISKRTFFVSSFSISFIPSLCFGISVILRLYLCLFPQLSRRLSYSDGSLDSRCFDHQGIMTPCCIHHQGVIKEKIWKNSIEYSLPMNYFGH